MLNKMVSRGDLILFLFFRLMGLPMTKLRVLGIQMLNGVIYTYKVIPGVFLSALLLAYTILD